MALLPSCHPERKHCAHGMCRPCYHSRYGRNPEVKARRKVQRFRHKPRERILQNERNRDPEIKAAHKAYALKRNFGISSKEYNRLFLEQNGCCAICSIPQADLKLSLAVDHDHTINRVRGLLCGNCNRGLGMFQDATSLLLKASEYLDKHRPQLQVVQ